MATMMISLPEIADVAEFVNIMGPFPFEAKLHVGSYSVDAKSIMGIFTLDREQPLQLEIDSDDEAKLGQLSDKLGKYLCKTVH